MGVRGCPDMVGDAIRSERNSHTVKSNFSYGLSVVEHRHFIENKLINRLARLYSVWIFCVVPENTHTHRHRSLNYWIISRHHPT